MFRQIRDSNAPSQPLSKPAELVTGLGEALHRDDTPKRVSGLWCLLGGTGKDQDRSDVSGTEQ